MIREKKPYVTIQQLIARQIAENEAGLSVPQELNKNVIVLKKQYACLHPHSGKIQSKESIEKRKQGCRDNPKTRRSWNKGLKYENQSKRKGILSPFWKDGISSQMDLIRQSPEYKAWRKAVYERDNYTCVLCGDRQSAGHPVILNADHIEPFAYHPELRYDVSNGRTLCLSCHRKTETFGAKNAKQKALVVNKRIQMVLDFN